MLLAAAVGSTWSLCPEVKRSSFPAVIEPNLLYGVAWFAMLNWLPAVLLTKQVAKFIATRLNALSLWRVVLSGNSYILEIDLLVSLDIDCIPGKYCFDRVFTFWF